jgi:hypothetical protein
VYTHLVVAKESAEKLYPMVLEGAAYIGERQIREAGDVVGETLDSHFHEYGIAYLKRPGCSMELDSSTGMYVLKFRDYLPEVPQMLMELQIEIVGAEIVRFQSAPTKARAGFYHWRGHEATATVERVFPTQNDQYKKPAPVYAQNITVKASSLAEVIEFNSKLSQGHFNRFLVDAWE